MRFIELNDHDRSIARSFLVGQYMAGFCVAFAIAVVRKLKYPKLVGLFRDGELHHAGTHSNGQYQDVRGFHTRDGFSAGYELRDTTEEELLKADPKITEIAISKAEFDFELLYPEHCSKQKEGHERARLRRFVQELEYLSMKHGFYLRSDLPREQSIIIYKAYGEERGYRVSFSPSGSVFLARELLADYGISTDQKIL